MTTSVSSAPLCGGFPITETIADWRECRFVGIENKRGADRKNPASATVNKPLTDVGDQPLVYKVGRLARSLANFAQVVELFSVPFVSFAAVTPQFNTTTTSMWPAIPNAH